MSKAKFIPVEQNSDEWFENKIGKLSASGIDVLYAKNAESTKGYKMYLAQVAYERLTGEPFPKSFNGNAATEDGHDREMYGLKTYENETFLRVQPGGLWVKDDWVCCSPDGLVGKDGLVEDKSRYTHTFFDRLLDYDGEKYVAKFTPTRAEYNQCMMQLLVTERQWVDLVQTPPDGFKPIIYRIKYDKEYINDMLERIERFKEHAKTTMETLKVYQQ
jgi:hypothetical protein